MNYVGAITNVLTLWPIRSWDLLLGTTTQFTMVSPFLRSYSIIIVEHLATTDSDLIAAALVEFYGHLQLFSHPK